MSLIFSRFIFQNCTFFPKFNRKTYYDLEWIFKSESNGMKKASFGDFQEIKSAPFAFLQPIHLICSVMLKNDY